MPEAKSSTTLCVPSPLMVMLFAHLVMLNTSSPEVSNVPLVAWMTMPELNAMLVPGSPASSVDSAFSAVMSAASVELLPVVLPVTVPPVLDGLVPVVTRLPVIFSPLSCTVVEPHDAPRPTLPLIAPLLEPTNFVGLNAMMPVTAGIAELKP